LFGRIEAQLHRQAFERKAQASAKVFGIRSTGELLGAKPVRIGRGLFVLCGSIASVKDTSPKNFRAGILR